jgi:tRNA (guanine-N7-)-methyltransferase
MFTPDRNLWYKKAMREFSSTHIPKPVLSFELNLSKAGYKAVDLEIGAGQGLHAIQYCQANPERLLLAVEKTNNRFERLAQRSKTHPHLTNLIALHTDAVAFVSHYLGDQTLDRVFLLYPNPYHKAKQANLRWHNRPFLARLIRAMKPGAEFTLATNLAWYAEEAREAMTTRWNLELIHFATVDPALAPRTHFEKKYLNRNETCWNLLLRKPLARLAL